MTPFIKLGPGGDYERDVHPDDFPRWPILLGLMAAYLVLLVIIGAAAFALGKGFAHVN